MTRRLTLVIVLVVVATLALAGMGTLVLERFNARARAETELRDQADAVRVVLEIAGAPPRRQPVREQLDEVSAGLELEGIDLVVILPTDELSTELGGRLPDAIDLDDLEVAALRRGETTGGHAGGLVFAAAPLLPERFGLEGVQAIGAVVLYRAPPGLDTTLLRWFLLASALTLAVAAVAARALGGRLSRPLVAATEATGRIAAGDLSTRLDEHGGAGELGELARSINAMAAELERSHGLERQFLLSVGHDLRTPLTSIRGYAEAIAEGASTDPERSAEVILGEARRLERLVRDLLDLATLDRRQFSLEPAPLDVARITAETVAAFEPEARDAGVELRFETAGPTSAIGDPDRIAQVVGNLVDNALKHAEREVVVSVEARGDEVCMAVADDGVGLAAEDLPHVFERRYVSARPPRRRGSGSGLGLAIVRELVVAMGGWVRAASPREHGARFEVHLRSGA